MVNISIINANDMRGALDSPHVTDTTVDLQKQMP